MRRAMTMAVSVIGLLGAIAMGVGMSRWTLDTDPGNSARVVVEEFRDASSDIEVGTFLTMLGAGGVLLFLGHLRSALRARGAGWPADGLLAGGVALVAALVVEAGVLEMGRTASEEGHAEVAQSAADFVWGSAWMATPGLLALGVSAALAGFTVRALPRWLGGFAALLALAALVPWAGVGLFVFWVMAAALTELVRSVRIPPADTALEPALAHPRV